MKQLILACLSALFFVSAQVKSDDLDIFLGTSTSSKTYNPNVLFIMDTSGSMGTKDDGDESRMLKVQNALKAALGAATNINAGLMRFSDYGGPVLYPVTNLNQVVNAEIIASTASSLGDGYEIDGNVNTYSSQIVMSNSVNTVESLLHFDNLNIPQNSVISRAYIKLVSSGYNTAPTEFTIQGELVGNATPLTGADNEISTLTKTDSVVTWDEDNAFPATNDTINTADISTVIQELVGQETWCGGNAINIVISGNSTSTASNRRARSFDEGSSLSPRLVVEFAPSEAGGCVAAEQFYQVAEARGNIEETTSGRDSTGKELTFDSDRNDYIGLHFQALNIPKGADIESAYITFTAYDSDRRGTASMYIQAIATDNASNFASHSRYDLRDVAKTSGVTWAMPEFRRRRQYETVDISAVIAEVLNRDGWQSGNNLALVLSNFNSQRGAYSYKGKPSRAPQLYIKYRGVSDASSSGTVRNLLQSKVDELSANGYTPIVDTLYEAVSYYGGNNVDFGLRRGSSSTSTSVRKSTRVSHRDSYSGLDSIKPYGCSVDNLDSSNCVGEYIPSGATYNSPVTDLQCQTNNHIVLLSDGEANYNHSVSRIQSLLGSTCASARSGEQCGLELVANVKKKSTSAIGRPITTHTIGFSANETATNFLNKLALLGGGGFYTATESNDLLEAFQTIIRSVKDVNATFVSPGVAVNQLNRLTHKDELYYALFKPAEGTLWPGNLKRYRLSGDTVLDVNGLPAVDSNTGYFSETSQSFWSDSVDGSDVREGGAASQLSTARRMYTFSDTGSIIKTDNLLHEDNLSITTTSLNIVSSSDPVRDDVLKWARGVDLRDFDGDGNTSEIRLQMGDPIHSQPVIVNYGTDDSAILIATNQGFLHSFDAATGLENFAVIPEQLLGNLKDFYLDNSSFSHIYGLDGYMVLREFDDKKYLYVGMRRGGKSYYVFDITNKTSPSLVFQIDGGETGLEKMGQTWSKPIITKMKIAGTSKNVMIIGGGYDPNQDSQPTRTADSIGNAVFIFDADNGDLLWTISNSDADYNIASMQYSIPGKVAAVDRDFDGYVDHLYISDMGAQLFRFDIYGDASSTNWMKGAKIADFGGNTDVDNRHFYYGPDVAEVSFAAESYYAVVIGSGWRAAPLTTGVEDRFYMLKDKGVFQLDEDSQFVFPDVSYESDLYDATTHELTSSDDGIKGLASSSFVSKNGWFIKLGTAGEKVLAEAVIINYKIFFTTYVPAVSSDSECAPPTGNSRAYLVNLIDGNAVNDLNNDEQLNASDRYAQLEQTGIAPDTKILIEDMSNPVICLGTECVSAVVPVDEDGKPTGCDSNFECLSQSIFGRYERVQRGSWFSEVEN